MSSARYRKHENFTVSKQKLHKVRFLKDSVASLKYTLILPAFTACEFSGFVQSLHLLSEGSSVNLIAFSLTEPIPVIKKYFLKSENRRYPVRLGSVQTFHPVPCVIICSWGKKAIFTFRNTCIKAFF